MKKVFLKPENIFLLLGSIFTLVMVFLMPINKVPDESTHAKAAWQRVYPNEVDKFNSVEIVKKEKKININDYKKIFLEKQSIAKTKRQINISFRSLLYFPQIIGMLIGSKLYPSIGVVIIFGRLANSLLYIISLFLIIRYTNLGKEAISFVSLFPIMIQQAASLSYDVVNYISIILFFSVIVNLFFSKTKRKIDVLLLFISILLLYSTKTNNLILAILLPLIYLSQRVNFQIVKNFFRKHKIIILVIFIIIILLIVKLNYRIMYITQVLFNTVFNANLNGALNTVINMGIFGYIGLFDIQFPLWLIYINVLVFCYLLYENKEFSNYIAIITTGMVFTQIFSIILGMYYSWTPKVLGQNALISTGAQGRYFTPFLIYLYFMSNSSLNIFKFQSTDKIIRKRILFLTVILNFLITVYLIFSVYWTTNNGATWIIRVFN